MMNIALGRGRRTISYLLPTVAAITLAGVGMAPAAHASYTYYDVVARHSGKCLDVAGWSIANGANVHQWGCVHGQNQQWRFRALGNGYYQIVAAHSGRCLDVAGVSTATGANVQQWSCLNNQRNQQWRLVPRGTAGGHRWYQIVARHSGKCLDVAGVSTANGASLHQWSCLNNQRNQLWRLG